MTLLGPESRLRRVALAPAAFALLALLLAGCSDSDRRQVGAQPSTVTPVPTQGTPPQLPMDRPPVVFASSGGSRVEMGIGTYCWGMLCVDTFGVVTKGTLSVAPGDSVSVEVPAASTRLTEVAVYAWPADASQQAPGGEEVWQPWQVAGGERVLQHALAGPELRFDAELEPGLYVVSVGFYFEQADVFYGVVLEVR